MGYGEILIVLVAVGEWHTANACEVTGMFERMGVKKA
jgi:hypothetical protein